MDNALELNKVSKKYEDFYLENINMTLPSGCIMGLIGENGAGKSTIIKLILNIASYDGGNIILLGYDNQNIPKRLKEDIGVVMDESCFPENLSAKDINKIMKNIYNTWDEKNYQKYLKRFTLPEGKAIKDYSRGMKMKLSIAAALSHSPRLLLLDEPTSGLDPIIRDEILDVFLEFIQNEQHSILISSHIISDLEKICDYITFLHKGKIIFSREKDELIDSFAVLKCSAEEFSQIDPKVIIGYRQNSFGVEALVIKNTINKKYKTERASIEDIMLYHIKERIS